jgi:hypothetical protein
MMSSPSGMGWYVFDVNTSQQCDFQVISINGFESLGKPYSFDIELVSESYDLDLSQIIGCPATLTIQPPWGSTATFYHGIITNIQSLKVTNQGMMHYRVLIEPRYSRLKQTKLNYIYTNNIKGYALGDLITEILNRQSLSSGSDYQVGLLAPIMTRDFVMQRNLFGKALSEQQNTQFKMAEMDAEIDMAQVYVDHCVTEHNAGRLTSTMGAKAKMLCSEIEWKMLDLGVQLHGGAGYMDEYPISRMFTDARINRIYAGTSEVMRLIVGRDVFSQKYQSMLA